MIGILALIFVIVAPFLIYRKAKENGHSAVKWTLLSLAMGLGIQIVFPILIVMLTGIVLIATGKPIEHLDAELQTYAQLIGFPCVILSVIAVGFIMRHVSKLKEDVPFIPPPTPPSAFE